MDDTNFMEWQQKSDNFFQMLATYEFEEWQSWKDKCSRTCSQMTKNELRKMNFQELMTKAGCWSEYVLAQKNKAIKEKMDKLNSDF
jgi:hypothetical protein